MHKLKYEAARKSLKLSQYLGTLLMCDGGFIKHYSCLLEKEEKADKLSVRKNIYDKYKNQIKIRGNMFFGHFAKEKLEEIKKKETKAKSIQKSPQKPFHKDLPSPIKSDLKK